MTDTDNASPKYIEYILDEVSDVGVTTYKHIYSDWTDNEKRSWESVLLDWSVNPIQQCSYTAGKNAIDSAMIIGTMDILCSDSMDGFYLVSGDPDFTKLAQYLEEAGVFVMGIGRQKIPKPFRAACDTSRLLGTTSSDDTPETPVIGNQKTTTNINEIQRAITKLLIENNGQNRPVILTRVGNFPTKHSSGFDVRNYGCSKFSIFLESLNNNDFQVIKLHGDYFVREKSASISKTKIGKEVIHIIKGYNGHMDNLSIICDELKKAYPSLNVKQHGFSRVSGSIRSFGAFRTKDNIVQLK